jgi:non-homologous end joining protein Ku
VFSAALERERAICSRLIDLENLMSRGSLDPVYLDTPYYLYPDGPVAEEKIGVIGAAMAEAADPDPD